MGDSEFPQTRMSNGGRQITVDRSDDDEGVLVFTFEGAEVGELHPPELGGLPRTDGMLEWPVRFEAYPDTTVLGRPDGPPITDALFYVDLMLDSLEEDDD
jgi:hypothetical protein